MAQVTYRGIVYDTDRSRKQTQQESELTYRGQKYVVGCLLYTSPSPRDISGSRMPSSA